MINPYHSSEKPSAASNMMADPKVPQGIRVVSAEHQNARPATLLAVFDLSYGGTVITLPHTRGTDRIISSPHSSQR
jgi:hypothetical protein